MNNDTETKKSSNIISEKLKEIKEAAFSKGFLHLLSSNALTFILGFLVQLFVAYILMPEDIGRIKFLQVFVLAGGIISGLGFNTSIQKLCSEKRPEGEKVFLLKQALLYSIITSVTIYLITLLLAQFNIFSNDPVINRVIPLYSIVLIPQTLYMIFIAYMEARKMIKSLSIIQFISKFISLVLIVGFTYFFLFEGYIWGFTIGLISTALMFYFAIHKTFAGIKTIRIQRAFSLQWGYAKYSLLINILNVINLNIDILLINYLIHDRAEVGYYSFAATLLVSLYLITTTIQQITTPYFSEKSNDVSEWFRIYSKYNRYQNLFALSALILSLIAGPILIRLIFSGKYDASIPFFIMLAAGWFIRNLYTLKGVAIFGSGNIKINFYALLFPTTIASLLTYFLILYFGIYGAGYGNIVIGFLTFLLVSFYFSRVKNKLLKST